MLRTLRRLGSGPTDRDGPMLTVTMPMAGRQTAGDETPVNHG
jgi:hypothetical protein